MSVAVMKVWIKQQSWNKTVDALGGKKLKECVAVVCCVDITAGFTTMPVTVILGDWVMRSEKGSCLTSTM